MHSVIPVADAKAASAASAHGQIRRAGRAELAAALRSGREQLLALFDGFERALGLDGLHIAFDPLLNLPLWELGHIGWFEEHWLSRNPDRLRGSACDPDVSRTASVLPTADALYDSSKVDHARRWALALPEALATRDYLSEVRESTMALLHQSADSDEALYFFRLVLLHEDMHREAWHFMAQRLGLDLGPAMTGRAAKAAPTGGEWQLAGGRHLLGVSDTGFAFDNELQAHPIELADFAIDRAPVSWRRFLPFLESGAYQTERFWTAAGWAWRSCQDHPYPLHLRPNEGDWQQQRFGQWVALDVDTPALHLTAHEAQAWCRWSGRRLPTEAEWEAAALRAIGQNEVFEWGEVWEWTASAFLPYPGFVPHPYRDYSQPWFDGRPVLRGGSFASTPHTKHLRYRNFFNAERNDVFAGFRSCALAQGHSHPDDAGATFAI